MTDANLLLNKELAELRKFVVLLTSEQEMLLSNDTESLFTLSEVKSQLASQLVEIASSRRKSLLTKNKDTMEIWVDKHAPQCKTLWKDIRALANQAQQLNTTNGELIQSRMRYNQQALGVLFSSTNNASNLYGPNGQANMGSSGRHLGSG